MKNHIDGYGNGNANVSVIDPRGPGLAGVVCRMTVGSTVLLQFRSASKRGLKLVRMWFRLAAECVRAAYESIGSTGTC